MIGFYENSGVHIMGRFSAINAGTKNANTCGAVFTINKRKLRRRYGGVFLPHRVDALRSTTSAGCRTGLHLLRRYHKKIK
jgi:hypothetical protein